MQANKAADGLLRDLGALSYAERSGRSSATADADLEKIVAALHQHEAAHGPINLALTSAAAAPPPPPPPSAAGSDGAPPPPTA
jgi:hypothetical protein